MKIKTVKLYENGWFVNSKYYVSDSDGARYKDEVEEWIKKGGVVEAQYSKEELEAQAVRKNKEERAVAMLEGKKYKDCMVSFTKEDGDGITQIKNAFDLGLKKTTIHFKNGNKLPMSEKEFTKFSVWFVNERNNFFISKRK